MSFSFVGTGRRTRQKQSTSCRTSSHGALRGRSLLSKSPGSTMETMGHLHNTGRHQHHTSSPRALRVVKSHTLPQRAALSQVPPHKASMAGLHAILQHGQLIPLNAGLLRGACNGLQKIATARRMKRLCPIGESLRAPAFDMRVLEVLISPVVEMRIKM